MPLFPKILAQAVPTAPNTWQDIYTVPVGNSCIVSKFSALNRHATNPITLRVAVRPGGGALGNQMYQYYDQPVPPLDAFSDKPGWTLSAGDVVSIYASAVDLSISMFGSERT